VPVIRRHAARPQESPLRRYQHVVPPEPRSPSARARREAARWYRQAQQRANRQLEEWDAWDEAGLRHGGRETSRREAIADRPELRQAICAAEQALRLAATADERYEAALLLTRLACDDGEHQQELRYARIAMALRPHQRDALASLQRAAGCNRLPALARQAGAEIERLPGSATSVGAQSGMRRLMSTISPPLPR
jgi:hypothetical protein